MPVTVGHILRELDRRRFVNGMAALADIAERDRDLVTRALAGAPKSARVDVAVLVETLEKEARERAGAEAIKRSTHSDPWRYELLLRSPQQLLALRDDLKRRVMAGEGDQPFRPGPSRSSIMGRLAGIRSRVLAHADDVEPDKTNDEDERPRRRRGHVPRYRPRSVEGCAGASPAISPAPEAPASPARRSARLRRLFGPRVFDEFGDITPAALHVPTPPWLLPPDEEAGPPDDLVDIHPRR